MSKRLTLKTSPRSQLGRKVKSLRRAGFIPANVFGKKTDSVAIQCQIKDFQTIYQTVGETSLFDLEVEGEKASRPVLIASVQRHPVTDLPIHVDFHQVSLTEKVTARIPVEIVGESSAVKDLGGVMVTTLQEIEVEALPTDLPDKVAVDITKLVAFGDSLLVKDLSLGDKITLLSSPEETVVTIQEPKKEEEVAPVETAEGETAPKEAETTVQGKAEDTTEEPPQKSE